MAKSAAERKRLSRQKKKEKMSAGEREAFLRREAHRVGRYRNQEKKTMTRGKKMALREYEKRRKREQRQRRKAMRQMDREDPQLNNSAFKTYQSRGKAFKRAVSGLPIDVHKKSVILEEMVRGHATELTPKSRKVFLERSISRRRLYFERKPRRDKVTAKIEDHVRQFYQRDDVSRMMPGKKDVKRVKVDGETLLKQKRLMLMTTREAYAVYKEEFPTAKVGKSKFQEFRPAWVLPTTGKDHDVCLCKYHENIELLAQKVRSYCPDEVPLHADELIKLTVCSMDNETCIDRACEECGADKYKEAILGKLDTKLDEMVTYYQWTYIDGKMTKQHVEVDLTSAIDELFLQLNPFSRHVYNVWRQHSELKTLKESMQPGEIIIHEDFSENYSLKHQGEVMSAHWTTDSCTLFTIVVYYRHEGELRHLNYTMVSDELSHTKNAVIAFNKVLMDDLKEQLPFPVSHVHYWSDGAGSQFKNRYCFANMLFHEEDFNATMDWSYFETAHGKGAVDGIGGTVKRVVWLAVLRNKVVVADAATFAKVASDLCDKIRVLHVPSTTISKLTEQVERRWKQCKVLPQTHKIHFVRPVDGSTIAAVVNTSYSPDAVFNEYSIIPSSTRSEIDPHATSSSIQQQSGNDYVSPIEEAPEKSNQAIELLVGQWYAAYFERYDYWYIGIASQVNEADGKVELSFLEQGQIGKNIFSSIKSDIQTVNTTAIFYKLQEAPTPISASRLSTLTLNEDDFKNVEFAFQHFVGLL